MDATTRVLAEAVSSTKSAVSNKITPRLRLSKGALTLFEGAGWRIFASSVSIAGVGAINGLGYAY